MKKLQFRVGSSESKQANVIDLDEYRERLKPPEAERVPEINITIRDGELHSTAAHVKPEDVPAILSAMARLSDDLMRFLNASKSAAIGTALIVSFVCADSVFWPAQAALPTQHASQDLCEGRGNNMHKWLVTTPFMQ